MITTGQPLIDISQLAPDVISRLAPSIGVSPNGYVLTVVGSTTAYLPVVATDLGGSPVVITTPINGDVITYQFGQWVNTPAISGGTVTSVAVNGSTGLSAI